MALRLSLDEEDQRQAPEEPSRRSQPIAIQRPGAGSVSDDSDDEEDRGFRSLPARLLRAPRLGSVAKREDDLIETMAGQQLLPPPMELHNSSSDIDPLSSAVVEPPVSKVSYGSLRESNVRGRFLDGPASYRDRRTGQLKQGHRVHFKEESNTAVVVHGDGLSIGERIMQSRKQQQKTSEDEAPASGLAAMMEGSPAQVPLPDAYPNDSLPDLDRSFSGLPQNALSASLTGLELLQRGLGALSTTERESLHELPLDEHGRNAVLARSFSDPSPIPVHRPIPRVLESRATASQPSLSPLNLATDGPRLDALRHKEPPPT